MKVEVEINCSEKFCKTKTKCCRFLLFSKLGTVPICGFFTRGNMFPPLDEDEKGMVLRDLACIELGKIRNM